MTDHITLPRSVVEQAIEALRGGYGNTRSWHEAIEAAIAALRAAVAGAAQAEPVAWRTFDGEGGYDYRSFEDNENYQADFVERNGPNYASWVGPLYTTPQPAQPVAVPQGWKLVPVEPTHEMRDAGCPAGEFVDHFDIATAYRAMLNAAPTQPAATVPQGWVMPTEAEIDEYIEDYEMRGDDSDYRPTEQERFVIKDAIMGLLAESFKDSTAKLANQIKEST